MSILTNTFAIIIYLIQFVISIVIGSILLYLIGRLASKAYFKSRQEYENRKEK